MGAKNSGRLRLCVHVCMCVLCVHICAHVHAFLCVSVLILSNLLSISGVTRTCFTAEKQPTSHKPSAARSDQVSVIGLCTDNSEVNGTSLPPLHLGRPTLVSPPPVRQGLSVKHEIKGKSGGREGVWLLVYHPSRRVFVTDERRRRNSLKTKGKGELTGTLAGITLFNLRRQAIS